MSPSSDRLQDPRDRQARAARILEVTAELLLRHGYRRVTIDDIARHADIGKGTIYLHWKTRDDLFRAVFEREVLQALRRAARGLAAGPRSLEAAPPGPLLVSGHHAPAAA
jgi:AcrR family transcriptional regulator